MHDSAVASVRPRCAAGGEHELLDRLVAPREEELRERPGERRRELVGRRSSAPGSTSRSTWISTRARRSSPRPRRRRRRPSASACATADSATPKKRSDAPVGGGRAGRAGGEAARVSSAGRPERLQLARRARQRDGDAPVELEHERRRRPGEADDERALGDRRLLADAGGEVGVGPPQPVGDGPRDGLDPGLEPRVEARAGSPAARGEQLDGAVVVGRPEPAGDDEQVACAARRGARPRARSGSSPTIRSSAGSMPSGEQRLRQERARCGRSGRRGRAPSR